MIRGPVIGAHLIEMRILSVQPQEKFSQVGPGLDPMPFRSGENAEQDGGPRSGLPAARKQPVLTADGLVTHRWRMTHSEAIAYDAPVRHAERWFVARGHSKDADTRLLGTDGGTGWCGCDETGLPGFRFLV